MLKESYKYLKIKDGRVRSYNDAGNPGPVFYTKGDAERAYWDDMDKGHVMVYLKNGNIVVVNEAGNIIKILN